jgi:hypothetical protein
MDLTDPEQAMQRFQGYHRPEGVLFILDEATGIPEWLWTAGDTITAAITIECSRLATRTTPPASSRSAAAPALARPRRRAALHGQGKSGRAMAEVVPIDAFLAPNLTGEPVPARP